MDEEMINDPAVPGPSHIVEDEDTSIFNTDIVPGPDKNPIYEFFLTKGKDSKICKSCKTKIS
jgi:hypothetical protein